MSSIPLYILAGGRSTRFGSDKARAAVGGVPLVARLAAALGEGGRRPVTVVAEVAGKYADLGLRTIADRAGGRGPMGGLDAALHDLLAGGGGGAADGGVAGGGWLLLASCDLVSPREEWVQRLLAARTRDAVPPAVAFRHEVWEPLLALYHASLAPEVERRLRIGAGGAEPDAVIAGRGRATSLRRLLDDVGATALPLPEDWPPLCHVNTPEELRLAEVN